MPAPDFQTLPKRFGEVVRQLRRDAGISQIELAELADLTHNYIGEIERGEKLASIITIARLAYGLGIKGSDLLKKTKV